MISKAHTDHKISALEDHVWLCTITAGTVV